ncbi:unnamed protein product, partial [Anisakis simplex]|uniref:Secreted protein n=1 Tax=Anisakis simplex TaxID=6269 RepID=A0A0M3JMN0_ANISI
MLLVALILTWIPRVTRSASCGTSSIPFWFEILPSGQPRLGCAIPSCYSN